MITHIRMKNFKSWKDSGEVELAPLTGFFGTNSSGKSSLLQMLLLLKQTAERKDAEEVIFFGDETSYVNLGDFREVIHDHKLIAPLEFEFQCNLTNLRPYFNIPEDGSVWERNLQQFAYEGIFRLKNGKLNLESLNYGPTLDGVAKIMYSDGRISFPRSQYGDIINQLSNCYGMMTLGTSESVNSLNKYTSAFEVLFSHVFYLGPIRAHPQRQYHWEGDHPKDIGRLGDKTIDALLSARVDRKTIQHDEGEVSIEERISEWLRKMNLANSFILERSDNHDGKDYDVRIQLKESGPKITLADMGYGLSQFLPVLGLCYYAPVGSTLILEQPGIHLHPKAQVDIADLLIEVINERKLQILVESHSEHLLTRLQLRIAEQKIGANQTALYFCENENGTSKIKPLELDELGNIKNWPKDFFGNVRGDLLKMTREQMKRQKEAEG